MDYTNNNIEEKTLVLLKPDALQRGLLGKIIARFEQKGLKIVGLKMVQADDAILEEHYSAHKDKAFFNELTNFMKSSPIVAMVLEGIDVVKVVRGLSGSTSGRDAIPGTIRGDFAMSVQFNIIHASDSVSNAISEIERFFEEDEIFGYKKIDFESVYAKEEIGD